MTGIPGALYFEQALNGLQLGVMLFLIASGLTLVLGIMNLLNLTHAAFYTFAAYFGVTALKLTGLFPAAVCAAIGGAIVVAAIADLLVMRFLYDRDHLSQLLATFGLLLFFNETVVMIWGTGAMQMGRPQWLAGSIELLPGFEYPAYRLAIALAGLAVGFALHHANHHTRLGMKIRAGASNKTMLAALGVNVNRLYMTVFCIGAGLAAFAGVMVAPLVSVDIGMGDSILVLCFVVITIGGVGSVRGAFFAAILIGLVDTFGRTFLPQVFGFTLGPALSSMSVYIVMAAVLLFRPEGLFAAHR
jgi:branched-chain amino acid transport system permease protein